MRTLVVSDLHLGARLQHSVLTRPEPLSRLLDAVEQVQRLVLLGDTVELLEGRAQHAMGVAEPVLRALGRRLGPDREVLIVPGNHDAELVRGWIRMRGSDLAPETEVPPDATLALAHLIDCLGPAKVAVRYPGAWLSPTVWATHGHYLDRHLLRGSAAGYRARWRPCWTTSPSLRAPQPCRASRGGRSTAVCFTGASRRSPQPFSARRCIGPASPRSPASFTAWAWTASGRCSVTCTASARSPETTSRSGRGPVDGRMSSTAAPGCTSRS